MESIEQLTTRVEWIASIAERTPQSAALANLRARAEKALERARAALGGPLPIEAEAEAAAREICTIERDAQAITLDVLGAPAPSSKWTTWWGIGAMVSVIGVLLIVVGFYMHKSGVTALSRIDGMRPVLVLAATISTIIFGGALLLGSLFSSEGTLDERFRRAREIFLVFSGVFGTVIGFYFGAGESKTGLGLHARLDPERPVVTAYASGGTPPYAFTVSYGPEATTESLSSADGWATFTLAGEVDGLIPLTVAASDTRGERGEVVVVKPEANPAPIPAPTAGGAGAE